ncbi:MAG: hypothetical protein V3W18_08080 [candidate division Zixibacteria bacterium]
MRNLTFLLTIFLFAGIASAQRGKHRSKPLTEGPYANIGVVSGPEFASFIDYVNNYYGERYLNTSDKMDKFDKAPTMSLGYIWRFYPNFALDVGFTIYSLKTRGEIINNNPSYMEYGIRHDLEYQVGVFSATIPVIFDFSPRQPVVPYVGIGISIFAMRLDDIKDNGFIVSGSRDTGTAVGGHFETGLYVKVSQKIWIDLKGKWHNGSGSLRAQEPDIQFDKFTIDQDLAQFSAGVVYYFR